MGRTFIRQETQVGQSDTYTDNLAAGEAVLQTAATDIQYDLNALRSQVKRILNDSSGKWYDDLPTVGSKQRDLTDFGTDLNDLENKRLLFRAQILADISVSAAAAASGTITTVTVAELQDNETFVISDGYTSKTFEFKVTGGFTPTPTYVTVDVSALSTANEVRDACITAINNVATYYVTASSGGDATVNLVNDEKGSFGNIDITDTVADTDFVHTGMTGGAGDVVTLVVANNEAPSENAAIGVVTTVGAVTAYNSVFPRWSAAEVAGVNALNPKNLCIIREGSTGDPILYNNKEVYALLQDENATDNQPFDDTTHQGMLSFVIENATGDDLIHVPGDAVGGKTINYSYVRRIDFDSVPEQAFLSGAFLDLAGSVDVTLNNAIDNQSGPATQVQNIEWRISDTYTLKFQTGDGGVDLLKLAPASGGDELEINVDTLDVNNATDADFLNGIKADTGGTEIDIGVTAGTVGTTGAADMRLLGAGELYLDDGNQAGSTWAQTNGIKLSDTTGEWDDFETAFGEVSLLKAIYMARGGTRDKKVGVVTTTINAGDNVTGAGGGANIDAQLGDYHLKTFVTDVDIFLNGVLMRPHATTNTHDVYPGTSPTNGDLKFSFGLKAGGKPDVITMIIY